MRVIAGQLRGRKLESLDGRNIRPTSDRVKESLFNILGDCVIDSAFLDLFGGTGSIGIEAISRGAKLTVFVDDSIKSIEVLRSNLDRLDVNKNSEVYNTDYLTAISRLHKDQRYFDLIFIDPPYSLGMAQNSLEAINKNDILKPNGIIIVEHDEKDEMPQTVGRLNLHRQKKYGKTKLSFYTFKPETECESDSKEELI